MKKRVVITGLGIITPSGIGKDIVWQNVKEGKSFITQITKFDTSKFPVKIAGEIKNLDSYNSFSPRLLKKIDRFSHLALIVTDIAIKDANLKLAEENSERIGIMIGNVFGGWEFTDIELRNLYREGYRKVSPYQATAWFPAAPQGQISLFYGIKGYSKTVVADKAGSTVAIGYAMNTILRDKVDIVLAGGCEAPITPFAFLCCNTCESLSRNNDNPTKAYKPFDKFRNGFVIGEGAGILVLEDLEHALKRSAKIYGELIGYSFTSDGYKEDQYTPNIKYLAKAIEMVLHQGGIKPEEVDYICADGSATVMGDITETLAIKQVFGKHAYRLAISASKSSIGNLFGASGAVDLIITVLSMNKGILPPTINYECPDSECDLNYIPNKSCEKEINIALINSRGKGGINAVLLVKKI